MKIYQVFHNYDVDGGFGDAIRQSDLIATFSTKEKADEFIEKYANPHIYKKPYDKLYCGELVINEIEIDVEPDTRDMWWRRKRGRR